MYMRGNAEKQDRFIALLSLWQLGGNTQLVRPSWITASRDQMEEADAAEHHVVIPRVDPLVQRLRNSGNHRPSTGGMRIAVQVLLLFAVWHLAFLYFIQNFIACRPSRVLLSAIQAGCTAHAHHSFLQGVELYADCGYSCARQKRSERDCRRGSLHHQSSTTWASWCPARSRSTGQV